MKLLKCNLCSDIIKLNLNKRTCNCGESGGKYVDRLNAVYYGDAVPIGFHNSSFSDAVAQQPEVGWGRDFKAFVIPKVCDTFVKVSKGDFNSSELRNRLNILK